MERKTNLMQRFLYVVCLAIGLLSLTIDLNGRCSYDMSLSYSKTIVNDENDHLGKLNNELYSAMSLNLDQEQIEKIVLQIDQAISFNNITDTLLLSDAYFLSGSFYANINKFKKALDRLLLAKSYREIMGITDTRYTYCLGNIASAFIKIGDHTRALEYEMKAIKAIRLLVGNDTSTLASEYLTLSTIYLQTNDIEKTIEMAETGLEISRNFPSKVNPAYIATLYHDLGISLSRKSEYSKSLAYYKEALQLYDQGRLLSDENKQYVTIEIAETYRLLKDPVRAEEYYRLALSGVDEKHFSGNYSIFIDYADFLIEMGRKEEGLKLFERGVSLVKRYYGTESRQFCTILAKEAFFVYKVTGDGSKALDIFRQCLPYIEAHPDDYTLRNSVLIEYARTLVTEAQYADALKILDNLLGAETNSLNNLVEGLNMGAAVSLSPFNLKTILSLRYESLNQLADMTGEPGYLLSAIETAKSLISLYDRLRIEMSDESRIFLGEDARRYYLGIIENFATLYNKNSDPQMLEGAFEYIEKSKVAGFLASMRELNATRFSLPADLASLDNDIQKKIGFYRELITRETDRNEPDSAKIITWEKKTFTLLRSRDSLIKVFEDKYPDYYMLKYNTKVTSIEKVNKVLGKESNLVSFVLSNEKLYIFIVNNHNRQIVTQDIDSSFFISFDRFRKLLSEMPDKSLARENFNDYMDLGNELYNTLLAPAVPYLKGSRVVISPDYILSYLPFETLVTENFRSESLLYREAPFALKKYDFSYIYSVTLSSETQARSRRIVNRLAAYAPSYDDMEIPDSLLLQYSNLRGGISVLPYAVGEAEDAVRQCGGKAYINDYATEDTFKETAGGYSIIHLAMHTLVDDQYPAYSKMLFARSAKSQEDGFLNTYEVYNTPLDAMMVVLSSCNTGNGIMITGEGILSLARGFLFAGSHSLVMSMWEVEDFSGAAVIKSFYRFIKNGQSKSDALRNARLSFLKNADQVRSHPYFWASLVVYGDDSPLYFNGKKILAGGLLLLITVSLLFYLVYKGPRS